MRERSKLPFWTFVVAGAAIICIPSAVLLDSIDRYERFISGFEPSPLKPIKMKGIPHRGSLADDDPAPALEFSDFQFKASRAKAVFLVGDFNAWKPGTLPLAKMRDGSWELTLPLRSGRYRYRFVVDGEDKTDPDAVEEDEVFGKKASVRTIK